MRKRKQEQEKDASAVNDEEKMAKADFDRVKERADLRHKTVSKKLKFYYFKTVIIILNITVLESEEPRVTTNSIDKKLK